MDTGCLDESTVVAFLCGSLPATQRSGVEAHLGACSACTEMTTWAAADQAQRSRPPGEEGRPFIGALAPGSRVDRYQILGAVGRGGMGEVYAAYHPDLDRRIALKVVHESGADSTERRARLLREARAIARLSHPNVIAVHDAGTVGERVYIAMEFVEGETVDAWLRSKARGWREILDVFIAAGRGLAAAHASGIVHRDFKPQNVMIGRDGSVRVMDFGLARMAEEPVDTSAVSAADRCQVPTTVTKTGALVGTPAYMAPEQFRGEPLDARADQFSFCVALYEALYGSRPALAHLQAAQGEDDRPRREASQPAWLRTVVSRGLGDHREQRFASMDDLLHALVRGRAKPRRRALGAGAGLAALLVLLGGWRVARGGRINCAVPAARLATVWSGHDDARRRSIYHAFAASGRPTAETSCQRVSGALDVYIANWSAMFTDTCEATNVRGEQSGDVLDLRMACLADNLDQARALTDLLVATDSSATRNAVTAVQSLTPVRRCSDVAALRSAVPLPKDELTLARVNELRSELRKVQALRDVLNQRKALEFATALRARVEAAGYRPLLAQLLEIIGCLEPDAPTAVRTLREAFIYAESSRDDITAATAASDLVMMGAHLGRPDEAEFWARTSDAILDRLGTPQLRIRSWTLNNLAISVGLAGGDLERSRALLERAVALKRQSLGNDHPDVAISLGNLSGLLTELGRGQEALAAADQTLDIVTRHGDPDATQKESAHHARGDALLLLRRFDEAEHEFNICLTILRERFDTSDPEMAHALHGLGEVRLAHGDATKAVALFEEALRIRERPNGPELHRADTRFGLARALWESGGDRSRALFLAANARESFETISFLARRDAVATWLATHKLAHR